VIPKIDYNVFYRAAQQMAPVCKPPLPTLPDSLEGLKLNWDNEGVHSFSNKPANECCDRDNENEIGKTPIKEIIHRIHTVLLDYHIMEGWIICPDTERKFTILKGIPNMILHEDEL